MSNEKETRQTPPRRRGPMGGPHGGMMPGEKAKN